MCDPASVTATLKDIISRLDPDEADVAICHLRDAISALEAVENGRTTEYARNEVIRNGVVAIGSRVARFR